MDDIVKYKLDSFRKKFGFAEDIKEDTAFEYFAAYSMLYNKIESDLEKDVLESISTGETKGIDTIVCCINGKIILNSDELADYDKQRLNIDFYFLQSKTTPSFNDADAGNFLDMVLLTLNRKNTYNSPQIENFLSIYKLIMEKYISKSKFNLQCWYVSLGKKQTKHTSIEETIKLKKEKLEALCLFDNINVDLIDKTTLMNFYKKATDPLVAEFQFEKNSQISNIPGVKEAYIGYIPFSEFKKLIMDEYGNKYKNLFEDNLRDFYGIDNNPINTGIKKTLEQNRFGEFSLLNNGITVIADANNGKSNTFVLENYQIVNGCQTSNVLFMCKEINGIDNVLIPLKVVITEDDELRDRIILSTNSQTKIEEDELLALTDFQKKLEDYYTSQSEIDHICYERRTNQYRNLTILDKVNIREQLKSFMAIFYDIPHLVVGNIGKILQKEKYKKVFFKTEHDPKPYYIAGLISKKWDKLLKDYNKFREFNKYRYHIFMGFRILVEQIPFHSEYITRINKYSVTTKAGNKINFYDLLLETIRDEKKFIENTEKVINIFKTLDYDRPKGAYSGPLNKDFISKILQWKKDNINDISENKI